MRAARGVGPLYRTGVVRLRGATSLIFLLLQLVILTTYSMAFDIKLLFDGSALLIQGRANSFGSHSMSLRGAFTLFKGALAPRCRCCAR